MRFKPGFIIVVILTAFPIKSTAAPYFYCEAESPATLSYESNVSGKVSATIRGPLRNSDLDKFTDLPKPGAKSLLIKWC